MSAAAAAAPPAPPTLPVDPDTHRREKFTRIYRQNLWHSNESPSGTGSELAQTAPLRRLLPPLLRRLSVCTLLDAPCGDFHWMRHTDLTGVAYIGADIVPDLIAQNTAAFASPARRFLELDLVKDPLPRVDLIFCRDCLVHLPLADIARALANLRASGSTWLLTTTFPNHHANPDVRPGGWRPLNLQAPPFHLPAPADLLNESCTEDGGQYADKALGLWPLACLP